MAVLVCAYGFALAFVPLLSPAWRVYALVPIILLAAFSSRTVQPAHSEVPRLSECAAAFIHALNVPAAMSIVTFCMYWLFEAGAWVTRWLLGHVGVNPAIVPDEIARVIAILTLALGILATVPPLVRSLGRQLYPDVAGYPTPYAVPLKSGSGRVRILGGALLVFFGLPLVLTWLPLPMWLAAFIAFVLTATTAPGWEKAEAAATPRRFSSSEEAVGALLRALDFTVVDQPRSGMADVDPFLECVDFLAHRDDRLFAILVRDTSSHAAPDHGSSGGSTSADTSVTALGWGDTFRVSLAASALNEAGDRLDLPAGTAVEPVLILVGPFDVAGFESFVEKEEVLLIHVETRDEINVPTGPEGDSSLKEIAARVLQYLGEHPRFERWRREESTPAGADTAQTGAPPAAAMGDKAP